MKKVKLPLEMANGQQVRSLQELRDNWDLEKVLGYYLNGRLLTWLNDRYYVEEAEQLQKLEKLKNENELTQKLCAILGKEYQDLGCISMKAVEKRNQKLERLRLYTADDVILKNVDKVAFDQAELEHLTAHGGNIIYLCSGEFNIEKSLENMIYIGIDNPIVKMDRETWQQLRKKNCVFNNCNLNIDKGDILSVEKKKSFLLKENTNIDPDAKIFICGNYLIVYDVSVVYIYDIDSGTIICTSGNIKPTKKVKNYNMYVDNCQQYGNYLILHWNSDTSENRCLQTFDLNTLTTYAVNYYSKSRIYRSIKYMQIHEGSLFVNCTDLGVEPLQVGSIYSLPELIEKREFSWEIQKNSTSYCGEYNDATGYYEGVALSNGYIYAFLSNFKKIFSNDKEHREITLKKDGQTGTISFFRILNNNIFTMASTDSFHIQQGVWEYGTTSKKDSILKINEIGIFDIAGGEIKKIIKDPTFIEIHDGYWQINVWTDIKYAAGMYWINSVDQKFYALDEDTFEVLREFDAGVTDNASYICDVTVDEEGNRIFVLRANGVIDIFK